MYKYHIKEGFIHGRKLDKEFIAFLAGLKPEECWWEEKGELPIDNPPLFPVTIEVALERYSRNKISSKKEK